jgi:hypothetical protein
MQNQDTQKWRANNSNNIQKKYISAYFNHVVRLSDGFFDFPTMQKNNNLNSMRRKNEF